MLVWLLIIKTIPEVIAIIITYPSLEVVFTHNFWLLLAYSVAIRLIWQSAIIVHGLGHTIAIAALDKELTVLNLTNILEHQNIADILKSLLPFHHIFIPVLSR